MSEATIQGREFSGEKLKAIREEIKAETSGRKGSQSWLAYTIGAHVTSISDWERGANAPSPRHLNALAQALGCDMDDLFAGRGDGDGDDQPFRRAA